MNQYKKPPKLFQLDGRILFFSEKGIKGVLALIRSLFDYIRKQVSSPVE